MFPQPTDARHSVCLHSHASQLHGNSPREMPPQISKQGIKGLGGKPGEGKRTVISLKGVVKRNGPCWRGCRRLVQMTCWSIARSHSISLSRQTSFSTLGESLLDHTLTQIKPHALYTHVVRSKNEGVVRNLLWS